MPAPRVSSSKQASHALPEAVMPELSLSANNAACSRHSGEVASETEVPKPMAATRVAISSRLFHSHCPDLSATLQTLRWMTLMTQTGFSEWVGSLSATASIFLARLIQDSLAQAWSAAAVTLKTAAGAKSIEIESPFMAHSGSATSLRQLPTINTKRTHWAADERRVHEFTA